MSTTVAVGAALAVACLAYVLYPLVRPARHSVAQAPRLVTDEEIEAAVSAYRASRAGGVTCAVCGPRPESDAVFCSNCGRRLPQEGTSL